MPTFQCKRCNSRFQTEQALTNCPFCERQQQAEGAAVAQQARKTIEAFAQQQLQNATDKFGRSNTLVGCTVATVLLLPFFPAMWLLRGTYLGSLFTGGIPIPIMFLAVSAIVAIAFKYMGVRRQRKALAADLLPTKISPFVTQQNVNEFRQHLATLRVPKGSVALSVTSRMLDFFAQQPNVARTERYVQDQIDAQAHAVENSYSTINLIIWCLPILGFIGTVVGIGGAVGEFAGTVNGADDIQVIKETLGKITSSLAFSFNTTLLALMMSIFVIFPKSYVRRQEERLLLELDDYLRDSVAMRLRGLDSETSSMKLDLIQQHHQIAKLQSEQWAQQCERIGEAVTQAIESTMQSHGQQVVDLGRKLIAQGDSSLRQFVDSQKRFSETLSATCEELNSTLQTGLSDLATASNKLASSLDRAQPTQQAYGDSLQELLLAQQQFVDSALPQMETISESTKTLTDNLQFAAERLSHVEQLEIPKELVETIQNALDNSERMESSLSNLEHRVSMIPPPPAPSTNRRRGWNPIATLLKSEAS